MTLYLRDPDLALLHGDAKDVLRELEAGAADAIVTSPPYLDVRPEYSVLEWTAWAVIAKELRRVVPDGSMIVNVGRVFEDGRELRWWNRLIDVAEWAGWTHRDTMVWAKPNANPIRGQLVTDAHEYLLCFGDLERFTPDRIRLEYRPDSIARMGRRFVSSVSVKGDTAEPNGPRREEKRGQTVDANDAGARAQSVLVSPVGREKGNPHPAPMPLEVAEWMILLSGGETILDPFAGSGTTGIAARRRGARSILIEKELRFCELAASRLAQQGIFQS